MEHASVTCERCFEGAIPVFMVIFILIWAVITLAITVLMVVAYCKIFKKTGYHWAFGLLILVPIANVIIPLVLAFIEWPIEKRLRQLEKQAEIKES